MNQVAKLLEDGLHRIRTRGWAQNALCDEAGRVCARGALIGAHLGQFWHIEADPVAISADALLAEVVREQYPERVYGWCEIQPVDFNNHPKTTQEDVERVFEKAIARSYEVI